MRDAEQRRYDRFEARPSGSAVYGPSESRG
jgi:hypothetical protein